MTRNQNQDQQTNQDQQQQQAKQSLKIGEKEYTPEAIAAMEDQVGKSAEVMAALQQYGMEPSDFIGKANQAFDVIGTLIEQGVIDENGSLVRQKQAPAPPPSSDPNEPKLDFSKSPELRAIVGQMQKMSTVLKALTGMDDRLKTVEQDSARVIRDRLSRDLKQKYPLFSDDDVDKVFQAALRDQSKDLWKHAEVVASGKESWIEAEKRKWAQEHGLDYDELTQNKLKQQDAKGGAGSLFKGKKMSFLKRDKNAIDPKHAAREYFNAIGR